MRQVVSPYPLRMAADVREQAERLAVERDRSLNWQLNELVKIGLATIAAQKEKTPIDAGKQ